MQILPAPDRDDLWPALRQLLQQAFASMDGRIDPPSSLTRMTAEDLRHKARQERLWLAQDGDALVGCVYAQLREDCVYVGKLAVAAGWQRRGVARALLGAAEALARQHGRGWLELQTRVELVENHRAFAALGFHETARTAHPGYARPTSLTMRRAVPTASA